MNTDSITDVIVVLVGCVLLWGIWRATQPRPLFTVRVVDGKPQATDGKVTTAFLERVQEVADANDVQQGTVKGYGYGTFIRLRFSSEFGEAGRQHLRNWWAINGWSAPKEGSTKQCS